MGRAACFAIDPRVHAATVPFLGTSEELDSALAAARSGPIARDALTDSCT